VRVSCTGAAGKNARVELRFATGLPDLDALVVKDDAGKDKLFKKTAKADIPGKDLQCFCF